MLAIDMPSVSVHVFVVVRRVRVVMMIVERTCIQLSASYIKLCSTASMLGANETYV